MKSSVYLRTDLIRKRNYSAATPVQSNFSDYSIFSIKSCLINDVVEMFDDSYTIKHDLLPVDSKNNRVRVNKIDDKNTSLKFQIRFFILKDDKMVTLTEEQIDYLEKRISYYWQLEPFCCLFNLKQVSRDYNYELNWLVNMLHFVRLPEVESDDINIGQHMIHGDLLLIKCNPFIYIEQHHQFSLKYLALFKEMWLKNYIVLDKKYISNGVAERRASIWKLELVDKAFEQDYLKRSDEGKTKLLYQAKWADQPIHDKLIKMITSGLYHQTYVLPDDKLLILKHSLVEKFSKAVDILPDEKKYTVDNKLKYSCDPLKAIKFCGNMVQLSACDYDSMIVLNQIMYGLYKDVVKGVVVRFEYNRDIEKKIMNNKKIISTVRYYDDDNLLFSCLVSDKVSWRKLSQQIYQ